MVEIKKKEETKKDGFFTKLFSSFVAQDWRSQFRSILGLFVMIWACALLWEVTFSVEEINKDARFILGFVMGTLVSTIITFYFGSSDKQ